MTSGKKPGKKAERKTDFGAKSKVSGSSSGTGKFSGTVNPVNKYTKASAAILIISGLAIVAILLAALFLFPGNLNPESNPVVPDDKKSLAVQEIIGNESQSVFFEEAYVNPENLIFRVVPTGEGAASYSIEYQIDREYGNDFTGAEKLTGITPKNPVELNITKSPGERVNIHINITAENGTLLWDSQSGYA